MKFKIKKEALKSAVQRAMTVSTKGIKAEFQLGNRFLMKVTDKLSIMTSNGHLDCCCTIEPTPENALVIDETGEAIIESIVPHNIIHALGGQNNLDILIDVFLKDGMVCFKDDKSKLLKSARVQTLTASQDIDITPPKKKLISVEFTVEEFVRSVKIVSPYVSPRGYKPKFQMICLHLFKDEIRFITGTGARFAIQMLKDKTLDVNEDKGLKLIIPADQANIIASVVYESNKINLVFADKQSCFITTDDGVEMHLYGIPDLEYVAYENHAFRTEDAVLIIDVPAIEYMHGCQLIGAVRDREIEKEGSFHSADSFFNTTDGTLQLKVDERRYKAECHMEANMYGIKSKEPFKSHYAYSFLDEVGSATGKGFVRFFAIDPKGTIIVEPVDVNENEKDENGVPKVVENIDKSKLVFFFAAVKDKTSAPTDE